MHPKLLFRLIVALTVFGMLGLLFFAIAPLRDPVGFLPPEQQPDAGAIYAQYVAARNGAIVLAFIVVAILRAKQAFGILLLLNGFVQTFDTLIGLAHHQAQQTIAPLILAALFLASGSYVLRHERTGQGPRVSMS